MTKFLLHGSQVNVMADQDLIVNNTLEAQQVYTANFDQDQGFFLKQSTLATPSTKVYGHTPDYVKQTLAWFDHSQGSTGVLLVGDQGSGKTLFAEVLHAQRPEPVVIVKGGVPVSGLTDFLSEIGGNVIILWDEFDKNFKEEEQNQLLTFFDGADNAHRLNIITANDKDKVSKHLYNRPNRCRYRFAIERPNSTTVLAMAHDAGLDEQTAQDLAKQNKVWLLSFDEIIRLIEELKFGTPLALAKKTLNISFNSGAVVATLMKDGKRVFKYIVDDSYFDSNSLSNKEALAMDFFRLNGHNSYDVVIINGEDIDLKYSAREHEDLSFKEIYGAIKETSSGYDVSKLVCIEDSEGQYVPLKKLGYSLLFKLEPTAARLKTVMD